MDRMKIASKLVRLAKALVAYPGDPFWLKAKYPGECAKCHKQIAKGDKAFYYPKTRKMYGEKCGHGEEAASDFHSHAQDEMMYNQY